MPINFDAFQPKTLEEAAEAVVSCLSEAERDFVRLNGTQGAHFTVGMAMRNAWLWDAPAEGRVQPLAQHFREVHGLGHADDMSGLILSLVEARVQGRELDLAVEVERYKRHWLEQGVDPLTQEARHA